MGVLADRRKRFEEYEVLWCLLYARVEASFVNAWNYLNSSVAIACQRRFWIRIAAARVNANSDASTDKYRLAEDFKRNGREKWKEGRMAWI